MAQLRPYPDLPIVFVAMSPPAETEAFRLRMRSPHRFIADPTRALYQAFGLKRASVPQLFNRNVTRRAIAAARAGQRILAMPHGDILQLAGTFIVGTSGEILWGRHSEDIADNVYADEIREHLPGIQLESGARREDHPGGSDQHIAL